MTYGSSNYNDLGNSSYNDLGSSSFNDIGGATPHLGLSRWIAPVQLLR